MKKFFIFIFSLLVSLQLLAHGPTPQKVQESVTVNVSADKAWTYVKEFGNIHEWLPGAKSTSVEKKGEDTFRTITLDSGKTIEEKLKDVNDSQKKIRWEITKAELPFTDYNAYLTVKKGANDNEAVIQWTARFYRVYKLNPPIPEGQDDATAKASVEGIVKPALESLKKAIESK